MIGARVDKIGQPNRDCVVIHLHNRGPVRRLVILAGAAPRLHFSAIPIEYPAAPPMFCLLLRKHLGGGRLTAVTQQGLDRVLTLHFEATNELGDRAKFRLVCELMGRQGNLVLVGENGKVIDAIHRVDFAASESRPLLSGLEYCYPPRQEKLDLTMTSPLDAADRLLSGPDLPLSKALLAVLEGASPLICRELSYRIAPGDPTVSALSPVQRATVSAVLGEWAAALAPGGGTPLLLGGEKPDFTFLPQRQYEGTNITQTPYPTCSELLEEFYRLKTGSEGVKLAGEGLRRQVTSIHERLVRKRAVRLQELEKSAARHIQRLPVTKDHNRQRQEAEARHIAVGRTVGGGHRVYKAAHTGQRAGNGGAGIAHLLYIDAQRIRRLGVFTTGPQPQAKAGLIQNNGQNDEYQHAHIIA